IGATPRAGYCSTRGCASVADCPASDGYGCHPTESDAGSGSFCRMKPAGELDECSIAMNDADSHNPACQQEAIICFFGACVAAETCNADSAACSPGLICCDLRALSMRDDGYLCTTSDQCPTD